LVFPALQRVPGSVGSAWRAGNTKLFLPRFDSSSTSSNRWGVIKELTKSSNLALPEVESVVSQYLRRGGSLSEGISREEFGRFLSPFGVEADSLSAQRYFDALDVNKDGTVDLKELVTGISAGLRGNPQELAEFRFRLWDINGDGTLQEDEFVKLICATASPKVNQATLTKMAKATYARFPSASSGGVTLEEFVKSVAIYQDLLPPVGKSESMAPIKDKVPKGAWEVLQLLGSFFTLDEGEALNLGEGETEGGLYFLLDGSMRVSYEGVTLFDVSAESDAPYVGEVSLFTSERSNYGRAHATSKRCRILALRLVDMLPLVYHDHKGACQILEVVGTSLFERLQEIEVGFDRKAEAAGVSEEAIKEFASFRKRLLAKWALSYHTIGTNGKITITPSKQVGTAADLSVAYSPGVAEPCIAIQGDPEKSYDYTSRGHLVGVVSNGTAVLGLGNIGALASKPVMEGKAVLFKQFGGLDSFDVEVDQSDPEEFIKVCTAIAPTFGGINIEDVKAPECFYIEKEVQRRCNIPIMHDDQHGTALIAGAGLLNGLELVGKRPEDIRVVVSGCGAAGFTCAKYFISLGVKKENIIACDINGTVHVGRADLVADPESYLNEIANDTPLRSLVEVLDGADVFLGLSVGGLLKPNMLRTMNDNPLVFALANPYPEIDYPLACATRPDVIMGTGRSDYPNQINNVLAFPYIFRGALDCRASAVCEPMKVAATKAIAGLAKEYPHFGRTAIIPKPFDPLLLSRVSSAVAEAAMESGVARKALDLEAYKNRLEMEAEQRSMSN